jgi:hypothetical protein
MKNSSRSHTEATSANSSRPTREGELSLGGRQLRQNSLPVFGTIKSSAQREEVHRSKNIKKFPFIAAKQAKLFFSRETHKKLCVGAGFLQPPRAIVVIGSCVSVCVMIHVLLAANAVIFPHSPLTHFT